MWDTAHRSLYPVSQRRHRRPRSPPPPLPVGGASAAPARDTNTYSPGRPQDRRQRPGTPSSFILSSPPAKDAGFVINLTSQEAFAARLIGEEMEPTVGCELWRSSRGRIKTEIATFGEVILQKGLGQLDTKVVLPKFPRNPEKWKKISNKWRRAHRSQEIKRQQHKKIEELEEDQVGKLGGAVLCSFCPRKLIVSTPNYECFVC